MVVVGVFFFNSLIENRKNKPYQSLVGPFADLAICLLVVIASYKSWGWYLAKIGSQVSLVIPSISSMFEEPMLGRLGKTVIAFLERMHNDGFVVMSTAVLQIPLKDIVSQTDSVSRFFFIISSLLKLISVVDVAAILSVFSILCVLISHKQYRLKSASAFTIIAFGAIGYLAFLFLSYMWFFGEYEGVRLASFERYVGTYFLAWAVLAVSLYAARIDEVRSWWVKSALSIPFVLVFVFAPNKFSNDVKSIDSPPELLEMRQRVFSLAEVVKKRINPGEKAYFVSQNSNGYEKYMFNYSMIPYQSLWSCWSVGEKYSEGDIWTCNQKLQDLLKGYKYLAIYHADERFWSDNAELFAVGSRGRQSGVYQVNDGRGSILLSEIH